MFSKHQIGVSWARPNTQTWDGVQTKINVALSFWHILVFNRILILKVGRLIKPPECVDIIHRTS